MDDQNHKGRKGKKTVIMVEFAKGSQEKQAKIKGITEESEEKKVLNKGKRYLPRGKEPALISN